MSAFALPKPPGRLTAIPSSANGTLRYRVGEQRTDDGRQRIADPLSALGLRHEALQHLRNRLILVSPFSPDRLVEIAKIERLPRPHPHLVGRTDRHPQKALELRFRLLLAAVSLGDIRDNGLRSPARLIAQRPLFDRRPGQASTMNVERQPVRPLEDLKVLKRRDARSRPFVHSVLCRLSSVLRHPKLRLVA